MVLGYHLQHPSLYAPDGLEYSLQLLVGFVERGVSPQQVRERSRAPLSIRASASGKSAPDQACTAPGGNLCAGA